MPDRQHSPFFMTENKTLDHHISIEEELKHSYLNYAMSVIVSRALPDVRDGLKPSQRRIMVAMHDLNLGPNAKYRKCAKIAGDTSGNYHPHGEAVIYPTMVRLAQPFNMRYPLVDGQGNFGSLDGDPPAAMRYTEAKMTSVSTDMLDDIDKDTVAYVPNYDETRVEPVVLPSRFPNLLANGTIGIAVGMATSMPPHNINEVCDGIIRVIENPEITPLQMCEIIQGPDFPTGAIICGKGAVEKAYCTGRGTISVRARVEIEEAKNGKTSLIFTEIPYQLNKARILENIAELVKDGKLKSVSDVRDESDREHQVRIVVELKRGENADVTLNQIYKFTSLQSSFSIIMIALVNGQPKVLNIKEIVQCFIGHRQDVIRKRTLYLLDKAEKRAHIVDGLMLSIKHIDEIIKVIRESSDARQAKETMMSKYGLSSIQTDAVLQMRLSTLTGLEYGKLKEERDILTQKINEFHRILSNEKNILEIVKQETLAVKSRYGDKRRTTIGEQIQDIKIEDIIADDQCAMLVTHKGYIKRMPIDTYRKQNRGGTGISAVDIQEGDFAEQFFVASAHSYIMLFSDQGKVYWLKVYDIPELSRVSKGRAIVNLINLGEKEEITSIIPVKQFDDRALVMVTAKGIIKRTILSAFSHPKSLGLKAIMFKDEDDKLIRTMITKGDQEIILATALGKACRFNEKDVRSMGRTAAGVIACRLTAGDRVVGMTVVDPSDSLLTICQNGYGKCSKYEEYRLTRRGAQGVINIKRTDKTGNVVNVLSVKEDDEIMVITSQGMIIRTSAKIPVYSRNAQGVKIIKIKEGDTVVSVAKLAKEDIEKQTASENSENAPNTEKSKAPALAEIPVPDYLKEQDTEDADGEQPQNEENSEE